MSFVVIGRPPGTITYTRRWRTSTKHARNAGRMQTVARRHSLRISPPVHTHSAAQDLMMRMELRGWQDLEVCRHLGDDDVRPFIPAKAAR